MKRKILTCALLAYTGLIAPSQAGPLVDQAKQAELLLEENLYNGAIGAIDVAMGLLWQQIPLTIRTMRYVDHIEGFGRFQLRKNDVFQPGEPLKIYAEMAGYVYGSRGNVRDMDLAVDFALQDSEGNELAAQDNLLNLKFRSLYENRETNLSMNIDLPVMPEGRYIGVYKFRDRNSDKTTQMILPFHIAK